MIVELHTRIVILRAENRISPILGISCLARACVCTAFVMKTHRGESRNFKFGLQIKAPTVHPEVDGTVGNRWAQEGEAMHFPSPVSPLPPPPPPPPRHRPNPPGSPTRAAATSGASRRCWRCGGTATAASTAPPPAVPGAWWPRTASRAGVGLASHLQGG